MTVIAKVWGGIQLQEEAERQGHTQAWHHADLGSSSTSDTH